MGAKQRLGDLRRAHPVTALVLALLGAVGLGATVARLAGRGRQAWVESQGSGWVFALRFFGRNPKRD